MSRTQEQIDLITRWGVRGILGIAAFFIVSFVNEMKADVKTVLLKQEVMSVEQKVMQEKVRRIERVVDRMEDEGVIRKK